MLEKDLRISDTDKQWMKLVDYFNQRREEKFWERHHFNYSNRFDHEHIISKRFWFIQWLVYKDKINFYKVSEAENQLDVDVNVFKSSYDDDNYYWLLMILAISDNPISDLISYLK